MWRKRMWQVMLTLGLIGFSALAIPTTLTFAQCSGFSCDNKDAVSEGCTLGSYGVRLASAGGNGILYLNETSICSARWSQMIMNQQTNVVYSALEVGSPSAYSVAGGRSCTNCTTRSSLMNGGIKIRGYGIYRLAPNPGQAVRTAWYP